MAVAAKDVTSLAHAVVRDLDDKRVDLGSLWTERLVIPTFIPRIG